MNEAKRLEATEDYLSIGMHADDQFDIIARMASELTGAATGLVSIIGRDRQDFKATVNFKAVMAPRDVSFCSHTIAIGDILVVPDLAADPRFADNPFVTGPDAIRFYAGAPLKTPDGLSFGSLCVLDTAPRAELTDIQRSGLLRLAGLAVQLFEKRKLEEMKDAAMSFAAAISDAVICFDDAGVVTFWNPAAHELFGVPRRDACGKKLTSFLTPASETDLAAKLQTVSPDHGHRETPFGLDFVKITGDRFSAEASLARWTEAGHASYGLVIRDLSQTKLIRDHVKYLTSHDRLTELPNRGMFIQRIEDAIAEGREFVVIKVGLDRFTTVNGALGISAGDDVLKQTAERIRGICGDKLLARLGGDEFGVLLVEDVEAASRMSAEIIEAIARPFSTSGLKAELTASVGMAVVGSLRDDATTVLKRALLALHEAKQVGGNGARFYSSDLEDAQVERHNLLAEMRRGFAAGEFELYYQPQVDVFSGAIVGAEALLRWNHPERGLVSPGVFIPALEVSDIALEVGYWIVRTAALFAAEVAAAIPDFRMGVNLFAAQLRSPQLAKDVVRAIRFAELSPSTLELEITETTVLNTDERTLEQLRHLRGLGIGLAFDDYGTGFASLSLLKKYPLSRLKIDREFIRDITVDPDDEAIVTAVIALGASLGLDVIAEGVETTDQLERLKKLGCRQVQGYIYGRPVPAPEFKKALAILSV